MSNFKERGSQRNRPSRSQQANNPIKAKRKGSWYFCSASNNTSCRNNSGLTVRILVMTVFSQVEIQDVFWAWGCASWLMQSAAVVEVIKRFFWFVQWNKFSHPSHESKRVNLVVKPPWLADTK